MRNWVLFCGVGVFAFGVALSDASAADIKAFHGAFCQIDGFSIDEPSAFYDVEGITLLGATVNDVAVVSCPLIRDRIGATTTLTNVAIEGHNIKNTAGDGATFATFACALSSQKEDTDGTLLESFSKSTTTIGNVAFSGMTVDSTTGSSGGNEGTYVVDCVLNDQETVFHVHLNESTSVGTD
jgi:hypothetical protein